MAFELGVRFREEGSPSKSVYVLIIEEYDDVFQLALRKLIIPTVQVDLDDGGYGREDTPNGGGWCNTL